MSDRTVDLPEKEFLRSMLQFVVTCADSGLATLKLTSEEAKRIFGIISRQEKELELAALMIKDLQEEQPAYQRGKADGQEEVTERFSKFKLDMGKILHS